MSIGTYESPAGKNWHVEKVDLCGSCWTAKGVSDFFIETASHTLNALTYIYCAVAKLLKKGWKDVLNCKLAVCQSSQTITAGGGNSAVGSNLWWLMGRRGRGSMNWLKKKPSKISNCMFPAKLENLALCPFIMGWTPSYIGHPVQQEPVLIIQKHNRTSRCLSSFFANHYSASVASLNCPTLVPCTAPDYKRDSSGIQRQILHNQN